MPAITRLVWYKYCWTYNASRHRKSSLAFSPNIQKASRTSPNFESSTTCRCPLTIHWLHVLVMPLKIWLFHRRLLCGRTPAWGIRVIYDTQILKCSFRSDRAIQVVWDLQTPEKRTEDDIRQSQPRSQPVVSGRWDHSLALGIFELTQRTLSWYHVILQWNEPSFLRIT